MSTTTPQQVNERGNTIVMVLSVTVVILTLLGSAVAYTQHVSRVADRSRKAAQAVEVGDGHLEYLFTHWRNISRAPGFRRTIAQPPTNFFYTTDFNPTKVSGLAPAPTPWQNTIPPNPWPGVPPEIPRPSPTFFPTVPEYTISQYRIQAVSPMIELDANENALLPNGQPMATSAFPTAGDGPNSWQYSIYYLAAVDVTLRTMTGNVSAKVRRVFEKKYDNPWSHAMFFNDDLEFQPSSALTIRGSIHTNSNLYIGTSNFTAADKVAYAGEYVNGFHPGDTRAGNTASAPSFPVDLPPSQESPYLPFGWNLKLTNADGTVNNDSYHELIERPNFTGGQTDPLEEVRFYNQAGYRVLIGPSNNITIEQYNPTTKVATSVTSGSAYNAFLGTNGCLSTGLVMQDNREGNYVRIVNVDMAKLNTSVSNGISGWNGVLYISDTSSGTPANVTYGTTPVSGVTRRGIRLINGAIWSPNSGITIASENPVYIQGNFNAGGSSPPSNTTAPPTASPYPSPTVSNYNMKPCAIIADAINVLSGAWVDTKSTSDVQERIASHTTINAALVSGNVPSSSGDYSGGGENFLRLQESWKDARLTYYGSMVQLYASLQATSRLTNVGQLMKAPLSNRWHWNANFGQSPTSQKPWLGSPPGNLQIASYLQQQRWYQVY